MPGFESIAIHATAMLRWLLLTGASATLIAGVVLIVQTIFGRWLTPAGRQRLWLLVVVRLLLPVLPASAMSVWNLHFENILTAQHADVVSIADGDAVSPIDPSVRIRTNIAIPVSASKPQPQGSWADLISIVGCGVWGAAALVLLSRLLWINRTTSARLRRAPAITDAGTLRLVNECSKVAGLRTIPRIVLTDAVRTPAVYGIFRARILMPVGLLESLMPIQQRHIILHEMSHIRHVDVLGNWILALLNIMHWFNPLLWLAIWRMKADREVARDGWVMRVTAANDEDVASYASTLVDLAQRVSIGRLTPTQLLAGDPFAASLPGLFGRTTSLRRRLHMIARLSDSHRRSKLLSLGLLVLIGAAVLTRAHAQTTRSDTPAIRPSPTTRPTTRRGMLPRPRPTVESLTKNIQDLIEKKNYSAALDKVDELLWMNPSNEYALGVRPFVQEKSRSIPEDLIDKRLKRVLPNVQFDAVGFKDVLGFLSDVAGMPIDVNWKALEPMNIGPNTPVSLRVHNVTANATFTMILDELSHKKGKLNYTIGAGYIYISTAEELDSREVRIYDVSDLLMSDDGKTRQQRSDELLKLIKEFIDHDTWKDNGGTVGAIQESDGKLIVTQKPAGHRHIAALLQTLRNGRAKKD